MDFIEAGGLEEAPLVDPPLSRSMIHLMAYS
jgi:hypothetical protein